MSIAPFLLLLAAGCSAQNLASRTSEMYATKPSLPPWVEADSRERRVFELLKRRVERYPRAIPPNARVDDALATFVEPLAIDLGCSKATISTRVMGWQKREPKDGRYEWGAIEGRDAVDSKGRRTLTFVNAIALNANEIEHGETQGIRRRVEHAALMYHELLHAQLLIDAMRTDPAWRKNYCQKLKVDFGPADMGEPHKRIPALEDAFNEALWKLVKDQRDPF